MATLPTTRPSGQPVSRPDLTPITSMGSGNVLGDSDDGTYVFDTTNTTGDYGYRAPLGDMPSDFASMLTLSVTVRHQHPSALSGNLIVLHYGRVMSVDQATVFAAETSGGTDVLLHNFSNASTAVLQNGPQSWSYINTGQDKTAWDGSYFEGRYNLNRSKGGDSQEFRVVEVWLDGTYTPTAPTSPRETRTFRRALQAVNRAGSYIVGPSGVLVPDRRILVPVRG